MRHHKEDAAAQRVSVVLLVEDDPDIRGLAAHPADTKRLRGTHRRRRGQCHSDLPYSSRADRRPTDRSGSARCFRPRVDPRGAIRPAMNVIYLSGIPEQIAINQGLIPPGATFIAKPYTLDHLTATLRASTGRQSANAPR